MVSENCRNFNALKVKTLRTIIAIITEDKVTEIFCMADDFCEFLMSKWKNTRLRTPLNAQIPPCFYPVKGGNHGHHHLNFMITPGVNDRRPLEYKHFVEFNYGRFFGDKGYVSKKLLEKLFVDGIQLITKLKDNMKGSVMRLSDRLLLRKRTIIETVNDELKNIAQLEHSRHRSFDNFLVNSFGALAAYCFFPKEPAVHACSVYTGVN